MLEYFFISLLVTFIVGFPLSGYAGVIVIRYASFDSALNQARTLILNMEQVWQYRYLDKSIPDTESPTGRRTVYFSKAIASNTVSWQLTQIGLAMKELGHWSAAQAIDGVWLELDELRASFVEKAKLLVADWDFELTAYIADWHRQLSCQRPNWWCICKPWPNKRYQHMSSIDVDESTGEWREIQPARCKPEVES